MRTRNIILGIALVASAAAAAGWWSLLAQRGTELRFHGTVEVQEVRLGSKIGGRIGRFPLLGPGTAAHPFEGRGHGLHTGQRLLALGL